MKRILLLCLLFYGCGQQTGPPQKAQRLFLEALEWQQKGKLAKAEQLYKQAIGMDSTFYEAYHNLAMLYAAKSDTISALESFQRTFQLKPDYLLGLLNAWHWTGVWANSQKRLDIAEALRKHYPDSVRFIAFQAEALLDFGLSKRCLDFLNSNASAVQNSYELLMHKGVALYTLKQFRLALQTFTSADSITPYRALTLQNIAMTHLALGDFHSAIRTIEASGKYSMGESTNPIIYAFIKAVIYSDTSEVITKMPKSQDSRLTSLAYRTQAYQLYRRHNYSDALDRCTRALEADTSIAYIYYLRAVLFHALGYEADSRKAKEEACKQEEWDACSNDMVILLHQELVP